LVKFVRGKVLSLGLTVGLILVAVFVARKFNLGGQIIGGFGGLGETIGKSFTAIPAGIVTGGAAGIGATAEAAVKASEDFQRFVNQGRLFTEEAPKTDVQGDFVKGFSLSELLNKIERNPQEIVTGISRVDVEKGAVFTSLKELFQQSGVTRDPSSVGIQPKGQILDLKKIIADAGARIEAGKAQAQANITAGTAGTGKGLTTLFGGFTSATEQEAGLQATLARNQALFPQFFK